MSKSHTFYLLEDAVKQRDNLRAQICSLIEIMAPAVEAARESQVYTLAFTHEDVDGIVKALIKAGEVLGI